MIKERLKHRKVKLAEYEIDFLQIGLNVIVLQVINFTFCKFILSLFQPLLNHFLLTLLIIKVNLFTFQFL